MAAGVFLAAVLTGGARAAEDAPARVILYTRDTLTVRVIGIGPSPSCFEATYTSPRINAPGRYVARE